MIQIIMLALFVEAIVSAIKPLWKDGGKGLTVTEIVSIVIGVVMAVAMRIDLFSYFADVEMYWDSPAWVKYIFYVMSGVALGRGPSFIYDLWENIKKWADMKITDGVTLEEVKTAEAVIDLEITHWSVAQLRRFCEDNGINCAGCVTKDEYIDAIVKGASEEPPQEANGRNGQVFKITPEELAAVSEALEKLVKEKAEEPKEAAQETEESACNGKDWCDLDEDGNAIQEAPQSVNE